MCLACPFGLDGSHHFSFVHGSLQTSALAGRETEFYLCFACGLFSVVCVCSCGSWLVTCE